jgi:BirA family biotin operon repressor/biotin-[acetyl-CoA-carboxylase] ligase
MFQPEQFFRSQKGTFGSEFYYFDTVESTNDIAAALAKSGCPEGTIVLGNEQTKGKGRRGSVWFSPRDLNLYFSLVLYPAMGSLQYLPFAAGLAIVKTLDSLGLKSDMKWPNDILVDGKKLSGVMIESSMEGNTLQYAILGCGVNVNVDEFPADIADVATSVAVEAGNPVLRESLLASILHEFENLYEKVKVPCWNDFSQEVEKHSKDLHGCPVRVSLNGEVVEGITAGLDPFGGLVLNTTSGKRVFYSGEVQSCRKN